MAKPLTWISRAALGALLTEQLRRVEGCHGATISIGPSRDAEAGKSNWTEFFVTAPPDADAAYVRAVAGGVVSGAGERYNVLDA